MAEPPTAQSAALGGPRLPTEPSASSHSLTYPHNAALRRMNARRSQLPTSQTWTTSSGDLALLNDEDEINDRSTFIHEYNRLAKKHSVRILVVDDFDDQEIPEAIRPREKRSWFSRMLMPRSTSNNTPTTAQKPASAGPFPRHKRSVSDLAHNLVHSRREFPKIIALQDLVRLSGKSILYLPQEYSPGSLILPTCLRATAQYIAQNLSTRGMFRIPGSTKVINALFHYYCHEESGGVHVASTVRCVNLPGHIQASVHDVASTFKRILSVLPGGILGSQSLFDALVAIHSRLHGDPEFPRTKHTKIRARLIALAISTIRSQFRREVICAVFGLLSLVGRVAEVTPREDEDGRPLPTTDLMGYGALGIVFGPLLLGDLLEQYEMNIAKPSSGLLVLPHSPPKPRDGRRKSKHADHTHQSQPTVHKICVANSITEMLIANWRDVVRQMKTLGMRHSKADTEARHTTDSLRPSASESFIIKMPQDWEQAPAVYRNHEGSPELDTPTLGWKRQRPSRKSGTSTRTLHKPSFGALSPTAEESIVHDNSAARMGHDATKYGTDERDRSLAPDDKGFTLNGGIKANIHGSMTQADEARRKRVASDRIPPRTSSKRSKKGDSPSKSVQNMSISDDELDDTSPVKERRGEQTTQEHPCLHQGVIEPRTQARDLLQPATQIWIQRKPRADDQQVSCQTLTILLIHLLFWRHWKVCPTNITENAPEILEASSINSTPRQFYSPMRVPALLASPSTGAETSSPEPRATPSFSQAVGRHPDSKYGDGLIGRREKAETRPNLSETWWRQGDVPSSNNQWLDPSPSQEQREMRPSVTAAANSRVAVRAMAAMWENQDATRETSPQKKTGSRTQSIASRFSQISPGKSLQSSRSGPSTKPSLSKRLSWSFQTQPVAQPPVQSKASSVSAEKSSNMQKLRASASDSVALRAAVMMEAQKKPLAGRSPPKPAAPSNGAVTNEVAARRDVSESSMKSPPSLGTMVPFHEPPPVAQHLNLPRPMASSPIPPQLDETMAQMTDSSCTPIQRPTSTTLHAQIRKLQRQLDAKTEEAAQLRRQIEAHDNSDVGTLSEQLREAKRELLMWKERAEAAERRVKVFEKFTAKLRGIREAAAAVHDRGDGETRGGNGWPDEQGDQRQASGSDTDQPAQAHTGWQPAPQHPRRVVGRSTRDMSEDSGRTEDAGIITARIRKCLHGESAKQAGSSSSRSSVNLLTGGDGAGSDSGRSRDISQSAVEIWIAAQELLSLEDTEPE
ncbi:hypothetical protein B0I35DRAFT_409065 [Stachybotrys elegans]|uniref:Rho-GAP domain-containing protein n=1 Tax=Stachybotrys elegans TaxID=80388 RepID=A0A8K0SR52_9HYPO|nr:hypothetical protein B0I35DRAFT_409065 [Stachybotrys elegans]